MRNTTPLLRSLPSSFRNQDVYSRAASTARTAEMWRCGAATHRTHTDTHTERHTHAHRCNPIKIPSRACWEALGRSLGRELMHCNKPQSTKPCRTTAQWQGHRECEETKVKTGSCLLTQLQGDWSPVGRFSMQKKKTNKKKKIIINDWFSSISSYSKTRCVTFTATCWLKA